MGGLRRGLATIALVSGLAGPGLAQESAFPPAKNWELPPMPLRANPPARSLDRLRWGSPRLESQLRLYRQYLATHGRPPDVLIVGSSRSLQGIDPTVLERSLGNRMRSPVRVFNFSINGATAQVVRWVLMDLLPRDWLPRVIVWGDGSRAFNSGRVDRTFASIAASEGFRLLAEARSRGRHPWAHERLQRSPALRSLQTAPLPALGPLVGSSGAVVPSLFDRARLDRMGPEPELTLQGFLADLRRFDPASYYRQFPKVPGRYDDMYQQFHLAGGSQDQAARQLIAFARSRGLVLSFVNLPLSQDYLDSTRLHYERQFQQYLTQLQSQGLIVQDWLLRWPDRHDYFADPSHINRYGAAAIAADLAREQTFLGHFAAMDAPMNTPPDRAAQSP